MNQISKLSSKEINDRSKPHVKTLIGLFERSVRKYSANAMFWEKTGSSFEPASYSDMKERIYKLAGGLISLGLKKGENVALLSQARKDWVTAELGILYAGAASVPLSVKLESAELIFRLKHSESKFLIVSGFQYLKIKDFVEDLPDLKNVIIIEPEHQCQKNEISFDQLLLEGEKYLKENEKRLEEVYNSVEEDDCALISYTSGTTADPKGIMLSHKNLYVNCQQSLKMFSVKENYRTLLVLPLDHSFTHTTGMYVFLASGASLASVQLGKTPGATLKNVSANIKEIEPDTLLSVPTLAKNLKKNIENGVKKKGSFTFSLFKLGLKLANRYYGNGWDKGKGSRILYKPLHSISDALIFSNIRKNFGRNLKYFVGGGALLDIDLQKFFFAIGIPMYQGYGLSEASPVISANTIRNHKMGSSGKVVPDLEVKICDEDGNVRSDGQKGEIVVRGDNVMLGYYKNKAATEESIKDGWLFTGDMGYIDKDGFLYVLGRFKSLLIGDDGEKYSPEGIEEYLEEKSELIQQIMIYNNQNPYTTALIFPDKDHIKKVIKHKHLTADNNSGQEFIINLIREEINSINQDDHNGDFPGRWLPNTFTILQEGFTEENQLLNSTLKIVRGKIIDRYKESIEFMYSAEGKQVNNAANVKAVSQFFD